MPWPPDPRKKACHGIQVQPSGCCATYAAPPTRSGCGDNPFGAPTNFVCVAPAAAPGAFLARIEGVSQGGCRNNSWEEFNDTLWYLESKGTSMLGAGGSWGCTWGATGVPHPQAHCTPFGAPPGTLSGWNHVWLRARWNGFNNSTAVLANFIHSQSPTSGDGGFGITSPSVPMSCADLFEPFALNMTNNFINWYPSAAGAVLYLWPLF